MVSSTEFPQPQQYSAAMQKSFIATWLLSLLLGHRSLFAGPSVLSIQADGAWTLAVR
ncbi:hypothetical protein GCM10022377_22930 [Zhihengliuella alba]|uniref:Uncharacterized protein n=1 Tax=Zhihengliuella alba TaxID=547018 RepID=A0ABP7DSG6_9MICC